MDRELQSAELARLMRQAYPRPVIFLGEFRTPSWRKCGRLIDFSPLHTGYVVTKPHAQRPAPYEILVQDGLMLDVDVSFLTRQKKEYDR